MDNSQLLTNKERQLLETSTETGFIEDYIAWAELKTDAAPYILKSAALVALSLAAGDTVYVQSFFSDGPMHLNLYVLVVGPSTTTRKSTVLGTIRGVAPTNLQNGDEYISYLSDTSAEAFRMAVGKNGKQMRPILYAVDEVAGLFGLMLSAKGSYLAKMESELLSAYDHSPIDTKRTQGESIDAPFGGFVSMFGATTPDKLVEALSADDVASGLIPRFVIFDATGTIQGKRSHLRKRIASNDLYAERKEVLKETLTEIAYDRACGLSIGQDVTTGQALFKTTVLEFTDEAVDRLDVLDKSIAKRPDDDDAAAILGRGFDHITKLSALFALSRARSRKTDIELTDVLRAIHLIETTTFDLLDMKERFGDNLHERQVNEVVEMLKASTSGTITIANISRKLKLSGTDSNRLIHTVIIRGYATHTLRNGEAILEAVGRTTPLAKRAAKAAEYIRQAGEEGVSATDLDAHMGKRGISDLLDYLVREYSGEFKVEEVGQKNAKRIRSVLK